jgi:lipid A 3-O-deacylase
MQNAVLFFLLIIFVQTIQAQQIPAGRTEIKNDTAKQMYTDGLRLSVDEDIINIWGKGTDEAYTSGVHIDYFYMPKRPGIFSGLWLPKAGKESVNTSSIGLSHLIFTPKDLNTSEPIPGDYPYAGVLLLRHSLFSFNPAKKYNLQSTLSLGAMGPVTGAKEIQIFVHQLIGNNKPRGWSNQLPNDILINFQLAAEKQLFETNRLLELIGGAKADVGSLLNAASVYGLVRFGKMTPYFSGFMAQQGTPRSAGNSWKRMQAFLKLRPGISFTAYNSLVQGGIILHKHPAVDPPLSRFMFSLEYGATLSIRNFSLSFTQTVFSAMIRGLSPHETGNVSLHFNWL